MRPATESELLEILCERRSRDQTPVTISGARTGLTGGAVPQGGWSISLERFQRLEIASGRAIAGAGVSLEALQAAASRTGQFYAPDPTERTASVGGTIATNASGSRSFRYGSTRRHILGLRVALMDGRVLDVRRGDKVDFPRARRSRCPTPPRTPPATCSRPAWTGSTCSPAAKARWAS